ncbi:MAG: response regulator [Thermostichus sp. DG_1_6_bins_120]
MTKTVLVAQSQSLQAQLWKLVMESQQHSVVLTAPRIDLLEVATAQPLDLMIVDMTTGLFNPYALCRDCRSQLPNTPVILTHPARRHIEPVERRWAIYQGATDIIPALVEAGDVLDALRHIYAAVKWPLPIDTDALYAALEQLGFMPEKSNSVSSTSPPQVAIPAPTPAPSIDSEEQTASKPSSSVKYRLMYRGRPVN